jgi:hypothetical protein
VPERVRPYLLGDPGAPGYPSNDPPGAVPIQPSQVGCEEDGSFVALTDGHVDRACGARCERDGDDLAALAGNDQRPVPALQAYRLDVRAGGLRHPQPVECEQGDHGVLGRGTEPRSDQQRTELVAVQPSGMRFVIQARTADVRSRGMLQQLFLDGVPVEPCGRGRRRVGLDVRANPTMIQGPKVPTAGRSGDYAVRRSASASSRSPKG